MILLMAYKTDTGEVVWNGEYATLLGARFAFLMVSLFSGPVSIDVRGITAADFMVKNDCWWK